MRTPFLFEKYGLFSYKDSTLDFEKTNDDCINLYGKLQVKKIKFRFFAYAVAFCWVCSRTYMTLSYENYVTIFYLITSLSKMLPHDQEVNF